MVDEQSNFRVEETHVPLQCKVLLALVRDEPLQLTQLDLNWEGEKGMGREGVDRVEVKELQHILLFVS